MSRDVVGAPVVKRELGPLGKMMRPELEGVRSWLADHLEKAADTALIFLDEERPDFPAECNLCNRRITYGEFASGAAVLNGVGEMWHVGCED